MDHFALPNDALAVAKRQGRLHRNFQGYSTQSDCDLIGLGVSSIGRIGATYSQNAKTLEELADAVDHGRFAGACADLRSRGTTWCAAR
jgi:oxygen-independent coproporphyrinogen-3 oxidase